MTPAQRFEAGVGLAMLPVGIVVTVGSAVGLVAVVLFALVAPFRGGPAGWTLGWCAAAALVAAVNLRAGIAIMAAFDWRPLPFVLLSSALIVAAWLALP